MDLPTFPSLDLFRVLELPVTDDEALIKKRCAEKRERMEMLEKRAATATQEQTVKEYKEARIWLTKTAGRQICIDQIFKENCVKSIESVLEILVGTKLTEASFGRMVDILVEEKGFDATLARTRLLTYLDCERSVAITIGDDIPKPDDRPLPLPVRETEGISFTNGEVRVRWKHDDPEACEFRLFRTPHKLAPSVEMDEPIYSGNSTSYPDPKAPVGRISDYFVVASRGGRTTSPVLVESALATSDVSIAEASPGDACAIVTWKPQKAALSYVVKRQILLSNGVTIERDWHDCATLASNAVPRIVDTPLDQSRSYRYLIQCQFKDGDEEKITDGRATDVVRPLLHVSDPAVTARPGSIRISWRHKETGYNYRVYRVPANVDLNPDFYDPISRFSPEHSFIDETMPLGQQWDYYVEAQCGDVCLVPKKAGSGFAFDEVTHVTAAAGERSVLVSWTPPDAISGISIERRKLDSEGRVLEDWRAAPSPDDVRETRWLDRSVLDSCRYAYRLKCVFTLASGKVFLTDGCETDSVLPFRYPEAPNIKASFDGENAVIQCRKVAPDFDLFFYRSSRPFTESSERLVSVDRLAADNRQLASSGHGVRHKLETDMPWYIVGSPVGDKLGRVYVFQQFYFSTVCPRVLDGFGSFVVEWEWPPTAEAMRVRLVCQTRGGRTTEKFSTVAAVDGATTGKFSIDKTAENDPNYPVSLRFEVIPEFPKEAGVNVVDTGNSRASLRPSRSKVVLNYKVKYEQRRNVFTKLIPLLKVFTKQIPLLVVSAQQDLPAFGGLRLEVWPVRNDESTAQTVLTWNGNAGGIVRGEHTIGEIEVDEPSFGRLVLCDPADSAAILIIPPRDGRLTLGSTG